MQQTTTDQGRVEYLKAQWADFQTQNKRAFMYDAAQQLGVSEAEILATGCGDHVTRLEGNWRELLEILHRCGETMALTRNHWAVIEKKGVYAPVRMNDGGGVVLDEGIDLRIFLKNWKMAFAAYKPDAKRYKRTIQFFDSTGKAVHKVYVGDEGAEDFDNIVDHFRSADQSPIQTVDAPDKAAEEKPDSAIDVEALRNEWANLQDTHDFFGMLKNHGVERTQAMRLVGRQFAERLEPDVYRIVFDQAAATGLPIMVFVGNNGCIEIHTGPIYKLVPMEGWFNIMDPGFNLHLKEEGVSEAWLVRKPTKDGQVTAVELYDKDGKEVALIFGKRKPGIPELEAWRELAESLPRLG